MSYLMLVVRNEYFENIMEISNISIRMYLKNDRSCQILCIISLTSVDLVSLVISKFISKFIF